MDDLAARLTNCFSSVFPDVASEVLPSATTESMPSWKSLSSIRLIMLIEQEFHIKIKLEDGPSLTSFAGMLKYLQEQVGQGTS
jgi:acyl carrier protein